MTELPKDFRFAPTDMLAALGGAASRFQHNVAALKLLHAIAAREEPERRLSECECLTLTHYSGWGDGEVLQRLFPQGAYSWAPVAQELEGVLTKEERESLAASALNAHYTPLPITRAIYAALEHYGIGLLSQLRVLEPAAGVGHFFGAMPSALAAKAERIAVEIDALSARVCCQLYPNVRLYSQPFEETPLPCDYFDLIISNVPFGNYPVHDPTIKPKYLKAAIHDYYFVRSLQLARPGGVIAFLTSRYTLDKLNPRVRRHLAEHTELLAAVRLPAGAFMKTAGTEVIADVLILRKRPAPVTVKEEEANWLATEQVTYNNGNGTPHAVTINRLYVQAPQRMLGRPGIARGMYQQFEFNLEADGRELGEALRAALIKQLPKARFGQTAPRQIVSRNDSPPTVEQGTTIALGNLSGQAQQRTALLLDLYTAAKEVIQLQLHGATDEALAAAQRDWKAQRLYTNNQWPNPVVVKITNAKAGVTPPRVETLTARWNAANKTVIVTGRLDDLGKAATVEIGAQYRIKPEATEFTSRPWQTTSLATRNATGAFIVEIGGLSAGQRYEFRVLVKHPLLSVTGKEVAWTVTP